MLRSLHIENVAVIKSVDIDFAEGFMALTGETGAGKSIILDSIQLLLGAKADKELIRQGESSCLVSGVFSDLSDVTIATIRECGLDTDDEGGVCLQRTVSTDGRSSVKVNGRTVNLAVLKTVSAGLVNIHGQSDTGALLDPAVHIELVDTYAGVNDILGEYRTIYDKLVSVRRQIEDIKAKTLESERLKEILEYQIKDIDALKLRAGEEEELVDKKVKIKNSEKITKNAEFIYKALKGSEKGSVASLIDRSITAMKQLTPILPKFEEYSVKLSEMLYSAEDIAEEVYAVLDEADSDPTETLNKIESRLDKISKIKRKYGLTIEDVLNFRDNAKAELDTLENSDELLARLEHEESCLYEEALAVADKLHGLREQKAKSLEDKVRLTLEFLDMPKVVFFASITENMTDGRKILGPKGSDTVEFYISANQGADPQPISKIASGGELARIMLALKSVISDKDGINTVIFDEIDAGVSGKTARKIGLKMRALSENSQIFCVTHSAQIASLADKHFLISKANVNGATETSVTPLDYEGRVSELSRILGGINVTSSQREAAIDMLNARDTY